MSGTIELSLAQPISRIKLFFSRYFAGLSIILVFVWGSVFGIIPLALLHNVDFNVEAYLYMSILGSLFGAAVYGVAIFFSTIFSEKSKSIFASTGVLITMYALNIIAGLYDKIEKVKYSSFFYYFNPGIAFNDMKLIENSVIIFVGTAFILPLLAALWFNKRDIAT